MSDISLSWGWTEWFVLSLIIGAPGIGVGALCGALITRRQRMAGGAIGAVAGWLAGFAAFVAWAEGPASLKHDYWSLVWLGVIHALPGLVVGAMLGAWLRREAQAQGAVWGGLMGAVAAVPAWWALGGGI